MTALLLGILADQGLLDPDAPVTRYIPEAKGSGYGDATVRHVLDMQVSLDFDEVYLATEEPSSATASRPAGTWSPIRARRPTCAPSW